MSHWHEMNEQRVLSPLHIAEHISTLRQEGMTIATLNGAFDLLHPGHAFMIHEAAQMADILIVALNTDLSIQKNKGPDRPLLTLEERLILVGALAGVDFVTWFEEADPCALLEKIRPDVHVNGEEYGEHCVEAHVVKKHGGRLHLVPRLPRWASSKILEKINACV